MPTAEMKIYLSRLRTSIWIYGSSAVSNSNTVDPLWIFLWSSIYHANTVSLIHHLPLWLLWWKRWQWQQQPWRSWGMLWFIWREYRTWKQRLIYGINMSMEAIRQFWVQKPPRLLETPNFPPSNNMGFETIHKGSFWPNTTHGWRRHITVTTGLLHLLDDATRIGNYAYTFAN